MKENSKDNDICIKVALDNAKKRIKQLDSYEKKCVFDVEFFSFKLKSAVCLEFLFTCLYSFWNNASFSENILGVNVKSLLSLITL